MNVLYEEEGGFKTGTILERDAQSLHVESQHKKRSKIKLDKVVLEFATPSVSELLPQAQALAESIDVEFLWECVGASEITFAELSREYYGQPPTPVESAALLLRLYGAPTHFHRRGRGRFQAATASEIKAATEAAAKRAQKAQRIAELVEQLVQFQLPAEIKARLPGLLYKPDTNTLEAKAVEQAAQQLHMTPARLLERCGAIRDSREYHVGRFMFEHFPHGREFANVPPFEAASSLGLPRADVAAFSIDDTSTTEIDDAFSVVRLPDGNYQIGIHIAAPALGFAPFSEADELARQRLSTVYMPGDKITMLPAPLVAAYTLAEGQDCPAVSLYLTVAGDGSYRVLSSDTRVESVPIVANLRYPVLDEICTEAALKSDSPDPSFPFASELRVLYGLALALSAQRGKGDGMDKPDFQIYVEDDRVTIQPRKRGAPSDKIVSELMIHVNSAWGKLLGDRDVRALFRAQDGGKVRMSLYPAPHLSLGVAQYLWASSPLRRYVDLVNQWLLLALLYGEPSPYTEREAELLGMLRDFELTTAAYDEFQRAMERFWTLRWFQQEGITRTTAVVVKENDTLLRCERAPLWQRVHSLPQLPAGTVVTVELSRIDLHELTVHLEYRPAESTPAAS